MASSCERPPRPTLIHNMLRARQASLPHENNDYAQMTSTKTPGRMIKSRAGLQENVLQNGSMTVNPKEKRVALQTPFRQGKSKTVLQDAPSSTKAVTFSSMQPLGDKTPKPNRQSLSLFTPAPRNIKHEKLALTVLQHESDTLSPTQPPSSSRKRLRSPRISKAFQTPVTKGDYWNVSNVSIEEEVSVSEDSYGSGTDESELEYMPPKPTELPYEPPFDLPDYKIVGQTLRTLAYSYPNDDSCYTYPFDSDDLLKGCEWSTEHMDMQLSLLIYDDDEIFGPREARPKAENAISRAVEQRPASRLARVRSAVRSRNSAMYPPRPATSASFRSDPKASSYLPSRPGTSTSNSRPPASKARTVPSARLAAPTHDCEDLLGRQFGDALDLDDDFRFAI